MARKRGRDAWPRGHDTRTLIDGHWVKRPTPNNAQRIYLRKCVRDGTQADPAVFALLGSQPMNRAS